MSYSETNTIEFIYFSDREDELIKNWLKDHGYKWDHNTVCGDCCGMYADEYWVNGIGGKFPDSDKFVEFAKANNIDCEVSNYHITAIKK